MSEQKEMRNWEIVLKNGKEFLLNGSEESILEILDKMTNDPDSIVKYYDKWDNLFIFRVSDISLIM